MEHLKSENVWITRRQYEEAEVKFYEQKSKASVTPLAGEVAKARQLLIESRNTFKDTPVSDTIDVAAVKFFEKKVMDLEKNLTMVLEKLRSFEIRVENVEKDISVTKPATQPASQSVSQPKVQKKSESKMEVDDDEDEAVDLFGSDSDDETEAAAKIREERLAAYDAKKSKKPALIAKSNIIFDVKPWDDETDMKKLESCVRNITADGLLWGAAKLVPLAYGIHKLQISTVVEDDKVSIDWLQEEILANEEYIQSVDIAAFNKI